MESKETKPADWREGRRLRAWQLKEAGWQQKDIAEALGVTAGAVSQWMKRAGEEGVEALRHQAPPGAGCRLSEPQLQRLVGLLEKGAEHFGFRGNVWTQPRVAWLIKQEFGVSYHPGHVGRLLKKLKWSRQKPERRASQRDEAAIERWRTEGWLAVKKKPSAKDVP